MAGPGGSFTSVKSGRLGTCLVIAASLTAAASYGVQDRWVLVDARAAAMFRNPAVELGCYDLNYNPAFLAALPSYEFNFTHKQYPISGTTSEIFGAGVPCGRYGSLAAAAGTVLANDVEMWSPSNKFMGTYLYHDDRFGVGYGLRIADWLGGGLAFNYDRHQAGTLHSEEEPNYQTFAGGAGVYVRTPDIGGGPLTFGVSGQNILASSRQTFYGAYHEPLGVKAGAAWSRYIGNHRLIIGVSSPIEKPLGAECAGEFSFASLFSVRGGVAATSNDDGLDIVPVAGMGVDLSIFSFDYTYLPEALGSFHYVSVAVNPGRETRSQTQRRAQIQKWLAEAKAYFDAGAYERAAGRCDDVLALDPTNADARSYKAKSQYYIDMTAGVGQLQNGEWAKARESFNAALALVPADFLATEYLGIVDQREADEQERIAEEKRIADKYAEAETSNRRGAYKTAIKLCDEILAAYPDHEQAKTLLALAKRRLAESTAVPIPEEPVKPTTIPAEAVTKYREGAALLARGSVGSAVTTLSGVVSQYPTYGAARAKLVEALLFQGLDSYSRGSISAALQSWNRVLALDPGNEKAKRYIKKAESEKR
jgi:tetratricopeptide (TPR) repeat protein